MTFRRVALLLAPLAFFGLAGFAATPAFAADVGRWSPAPPPPAGTSDTYIVTLSGNGQLVPRFPGSDKITGVVYPSLSFRRSDEPPRFAAPDDGISISLLDTPMLRIGPVFRYQSGRYLSDDRRLFGLRKLDWDVEAGAFVEYWPISFIRARIEVRHGVRESSGFVGNLGIDVVQPIDRFVFSVGPRLTLGDDSWARRYFGVSPNEAALSARFFPFRPDGGLTSVGVLGAVTYTWNETWATTGYVGYNHLVGDVADSPIVRRIGSREQLMVGAKLSYSFSVTP